MPDVRTRSALHAILLMAALGITTLAPASSAAAAQAAGAWKLQVDWPDGRADVILTVTEKDGALTATWAGPRGTLPADAVSIADGVLTFVLQVKDQDGNPLELRFEGRIAGERIDGHLAMPRGRAIKVTGQRQGSMR